MVGLLFGASFGFLGSLFQGGPPLRLGMLESAEWFAVAGAAGGWLLGVTATATGPQTIAAARPRPSE